MFKSLERLAGPFQSKGRLVELRVAGEFRGPAPLIELCARAREVCEANAGAKFVGFKAVEDMHRSGICPSVKGNSFPTDLLVVFEPLGGKLRDRVIYEEPTGNRLIFPTGEHTGASVALLVEGLHKLKFTPDGKDRLIEISEGSIIVVSGFAKQEGWHHMDPETGVPFGQPINPNGTVDPGLRFIGLPLGSEDRYSSFIGPFTRSLGRQFIGTAVKPADKNWLVFEFPVTQ
ncbi:hypothetical protein HYT84_03255 [Candidatus Micrarchaeota archaeon]|nr:hypothetical protein [Candidatus Micrarchaeota archaeon]